MPKRILNTDLIKQPAFWAVHMWNITRGPISCGESEIADSTFGLTDGAIDEFYSKQISIEPLSPYIHIPLSSGYSIEVEYSNDPEDHQVIYQVCPREGATSICVGIGGGHWRLPAFRWAELVQISQAVINDGDGTPQVAARALLLLLPSVWLTRDDNLFDIRQHLINAWENLHVVPHAQIPLLAEELIAASQSEVQWRSHERFGWVNDGGNSVRNPHSSGCLNAQELSALRTFFRKH